MWVATSDSDGRAIVPFTLGPDEGIANNVVKVRLDGGPEPGSVVGFSATGRAAGDPAATTISGLVLDNSAQPVPGVTIRIRGNGLTTQTDASGQFRLAPAPVGTIQMIVDGSTAQRPGSWPDLEYILTTIPGRDNTVNMPIFLLPIDLGHGVLVDETHGAMLTIQEIPGFALEIAPGSVTFPGGSRSGLVSVTVVHNDKVPMVPNFGQQPRLIVTIQPPGARFDPPARLTLPNVEGLAPGEVTEMYSFDHDLGHFVSIGPATVSEDGSEVVSNPGVGVLKSGWHCHGNPPASGTPHACEGECSKCDGIFCVPDDFKACDDNDPCTIRDVCLGGKCGGEPVTIDAIEGPCAAACNEPADFLVQSNAPSRIDWKAQLGMPETGVGPTFRTRWECTGITRRFVESKCSPQAKSKPVLLARACVNHSQLQLERNLGAPPPGCEGPNAAFGYVAPRGYRLFTLECSKEMKLCTQFEGIGAKYIEEFGNCGRKPIVNENDPTITALTCRDVIADLTPPSVGSSDGPPRMKYWSPQLTEAHEEVHVQQLERLINQNFLPAADLLVAEDRWCDDACGNKQQSPPGDLVSELARLWGTAITATWENAESREDREVQAHNAIRDQYVSLVASIKARAVRENWTLCQ